VPFLDNISSREIIAGLLIINLLTFIVYGLDKYFSTHGYWRMPEKNLLLLAFIGGSPAAFFARRLFRHKTSKRSFVIRFRVVVIVQIMLIILAFYLKDKVW